MVNIIRRNENREGDRDRNGEIKYCFISEELKSDQDGSQRKKIGN